MSKTIMITGATSGIGLAIAKKFAQEGQRLVLTGRRKDRLATIKDQLESQYAISVYPYPMDVTDYSQVAHDCHQILDQVGPIDILINNAGLALGLEKYHEADSQDLMTMVDTNIKGLMAVSRHILPSMVERNQGHIINMGSTAGLYAYAGAAVYAATKAAVKVLSDGMRIDTIDTAIKVTTIQPGIVETDFSQVRFHGDKEKAKAVYEGVDALQSRRHR